MTGRIRLTEEQLDAFARNAGAPEIASAASRPKRTRKPSAAAADAVAAQISRSQKGQHWTKRGTGKRKARGVMNATEKAYAQLLQVRLLAGEIEWWAYEAWTFVLGPACRYTPDFAVMLADGSLECHEVKGFMSDAARVKTRTFVELFPLPLFIVKKVSKAKGSWQIKPV